ncbi:tripartite tricarboxylate transporter permease [Citricoccus sp. I39-566]|uniref:tripartite tricarboxylate transporter permease n=1 Tax=Citricoccus sp. I39-566 TaxID=3073268 RepID=UPI00286D4194|nr:tripartite tricarboxylate transporter permease [Citricoccus sp. I39-566]WMY78557.1 tripartite tricarboxylate transporter permease [Citricoccus sp. I39-566]
MSGFEVALSPVNLLFVAIGVLVGTIVGLLPGLGPTASLALLLPLTFSLEPATAIIMLAGIYYGTMYGGRIPAILLRLPGDSSSVMTTLDGYPMTQQGRAGPALGITAIGSFLGGTVAIIGLTFLAPVVANFASSIGAPEMFALTVVGVMMISLLGSGSTWKAIAIAGLGILVSVVGLDPIDGTQRLTFGSIELSGGIDIVPIAVGLFGLGEIFHSMETGAHEALKSTKLGRILPTRVDWLRSRFAILRSSILGFFVGLMPGGGGTISSVLAYGMEKRISKRPKKFGKGAVEGLAATETADNASSNSAFIPLLTLGIPPNAVLAVIYGALLLQNITPGPELINEEPDVFWGVIASMYIGNVLLLILNLPLIAAFVQILRIPGYVLNPIIVVVALLGVYSVNNTMFDVYVAIVFGVLGYLLKKWRFDLGPFILGFILGPIMEVQFRRAMLMSDGSLGIFVERPVSLAMFIVVAIAISFTVINFLRSRRTGRQTAGSRVMHAVTHSDEYAEEVREDSLLDDGSETELEAGTDSAATGEPAAGGPERIPSGTGASEARPDSPEKPTTAVRKAPPPLDQQQ